LVDVLSDLTMLLLVLIVALATLLVAVEVVVVAVEALVIAVAAEVAVEAVVDSEIEGVVEVLGVDAEAAQTVVDLVTSRGRSRHLNNLVTSLRTAGFFAAHKTG